MGTLADKIKQRRKDLAKKHDESYQRTTEKTFNTIFLLDKLREAGRQIWLPERGKTHTIDVVPFLAGSQHPHDAEGELSTMIDLWIYKGIGVMNEVFVAPSKVWRNRDPIAEYKSLAGRVPKEEFKQITPKRYGAYWVWVHDTPEEEAKGLQAYLESFFFFHEHVEEIALIPEGGGKVLYTDPEVGKRICYSIKETSYTDDSGASRKGIQYSGHRFLDRSGPIPDWVLEQALPLDEFIDMHPSYERIYEAFYARPFDEAEVGTVTPVHKKPAAATHQQPSTYTPPAGQGTPPPSGGTEDNPCPSGHLFGQDFEKKRECSGCPKWDFCRDEYQRLQPKEKALTDYPSTGKFCTVCGKPTYSTPSGAVCENGHGGSAQADTPPEPPKDSSTQSPATPATTETPAEPAATTSTGAAPKRKLLIKKKTQ